MLKKPVLIIAPSFEFSHRWLIVQVQLNVDEQMMELDTVPSSAFPQISAGCFV
jgi:hypothetical protein